MRRKILFLVAAALTAGACIAQPSTYFLWKDASGKTMCNPDAPGPGWSKVGGPFEDSNCTIPQPQ